MLEQVEATFRRCLGNSEETKSVEFQYDAFLSHNQADKPGRDGWRNGCERRGCACGFDHEHPALANLPSAVVI